MSDQQEDSSLSLLMRMTKWCHQERSWLGCVILSTQNSMRSWCWGWIVIFSLLIFFIMFRINTQESSPTPENAYHWGGTHCCGNGACQREDSWSRWLTVKFVERIGIFLCKVFALWLMNPCSKVFSPIKADRANVATLVWIVKQFQSASCLEVIGPRVWLTSADEEMLRHDWQHTSGSGQQLTTSIDFWARLLVKYGIQDIDNLLVDWMKGNSNIEHVLTSL